jgi:hypothetical protein
MDDRVLKEALLTAFEYSYLHEDWVSPLQDVLAGLDATEARFRTTPEGKCIWEVLLHVAVWNENIVERIRTGQATRPVEGAWPQMPDSGDEAAFEQAKARLWASLDSVRLTIADSPVSLLAAAPYGIADLICRFTHIGYHLGQITKLRQSYPSSTLKA